MLVVFVSVVLLAAGSGGAEGKTITVDDDGKGDYEKIQDAIDAAGDGDTIKVWKGTYEENVMVDRIVSLIGNGSEEVTVDGGGSGHVVNITADWVNMSGFSITRSGRTDSLDYDSAGIKVEADHCSFFNNN